MYVAIPNSVVKAVSGPLSASLCSSSSAEIPKWGECALSVFYCYFFGCWMQGAKRSQLYKYCINELLLLQVVF